MGQGVPVLQREILEMWDAVRDRVELSGGDPTWRVTAGGFDSALTYARARFGEPVVLARKDRDRWWPRVTLTVTTDALLAASAPRLEYFAWPVRQRQRRRTRWTRWSGWARWSRWTRRRSRPWEPLPPSLEAIFTHQEQLRLDEGGPGQGLPGQGIPQQRIPRQRVPQR